jgi:trans-2,3-dihydro-3-hydroxyanthranilate isomerase
MKRRYCTVDVFTSRMFGGNPLAVVLDAQGLSPAQMRSIAAEFNYSETTFVLPGASPGIDAEVRIFTPRSELPFAGHPNVGTAFVLAGQAAAPPQRLIFQQRAGIVRVAVLKEGGRVTGAEVAAPLPLIRGSVAPVDATAACLTLAAGDIRTDRHSPAIASVGAAFLFVELASRAALSRAASDLAAQRAVLPLEGAFGIYAYVREGAEILHARMFAPLEGIAEDPATGSATAAVAALVAELDGANSVALRVHQGDDVGRPSLMLARAERRAADITGFVGGACVPVMQGTFDLPGAES